MNTTRRKAAGTVVLRGELGDLFGFLFQGMELQRLAA